MRWTRSILAAAVGALWVPGVLSAGPWVAADYGDKEPNFPAGSYEYHTGEYKNCPVIYRTVLQVEDRPIAFAGFKGKATQYGFVFLNGRQIGGRRGGVDEVELAHLLKPGKNVLAISTKSEGLALDGAIGYVGGPVQRFGTDTANWKVQKFAPLTLLEDQPFMKADFDAAAWFAVKTTEAEAINLTDQAVQEMCDRLAKVRLTEWDTDAKWRLQMIAERGYAVVDWESYGFGGPGRLPEWVRTVAASAGTDAAPGALYQRAEALSRYLVLNDDATNLEAQAVGLAAINAPGGDANAYRAAAETIRGALATMAESLKSQKFAQAITDGAPAQAASDAVRKGRYVNRLNAAIDNKFSWFDTTALLESGPKDLDVTVGAGASSYSSPLSPATLITAHDTTLTLTGWSRTQKNNNNTFSGPNNQKTTPSGAPVAVWMVIDKKVVGKKASGVVYDAATDGKLSENWVTLNADLSHSGLLPVELVFVNAPTKIEIGTAGKATEVKVTFAKAEGQVFILRPLKEWRGILEEARTLAAVAPNERGAGRYIDQFRLYSRSLLEYPVSYSESFVKDPQKAWSLLVSDVYQYQQFKDDWATQPQRLAPLPPMAAYGLVTNYPGLEVISASKNFGSWGNWGDQIAAVGQDHIEYRVPMDPMKRFGGYTSYCFGNTDIGEPGGLREIQSVAATGSNSFRPQHNSTADRAIKTVQWCIDNGLQNVFNTDEKWVGDVVEHYRTLAQKCKDFPPDAVAYDLLNEPQTREPHDYGVLMKRITNAIRSVDKTHPIYVEVIAPWGPGAKPYPQGAFETLEPTGDPLTVYSFHDYAFRLGRYEIKEQSSEGQDTGRAYWPDTRANVSDIMTRWIPAFRYAIDNRAAIHLGEWGGFEQTKQSVWENPSALTMTMDYMKVFDQFGWHWHYYANRGTIRIRPDGSMQESYVEAAVRRDMARGSLNLNRK